MVILDEYERALHFEHKMWNVLTPNLDQKSSTADLVELITQIANEDELEEHIYIYATGSLVYEAIEAGVRSFANALFLEDVNLSEDELLKITRLFEEVKTTPILYICGKTATTELVKKIATASYVRVRSFACESLFDSKEQRIKEVMDMLAKESSA